MGNVYPATYLENHQVMETSYFTDRDEAMDFAREQRRKGWKVTTRRICPFSQYIWVIEGVKDK